MKLKACVIAHYDPDGIWDENFLRMLTVVLLVVDRVVLVTTAITMPDLPMEFADIQLIRRPNVGYDFYSYRVGLSQVIGDENFDGIFLLNSSLVILSVVHFSDLLHSMADKNRRSAVRGVTSSSQIDWHIQSYLIYFDLKRMSRYWLSNFFNKVQPLNTKLEVVLAFEIGLSKEIVADKILVDIIFKPSLKLKVYGTFSWMRVLARSSGYFGWFKKATWKAMNEVNWVHFGAIDLANNFGFVKSEVLRSNPHKVDTEKIIRMCDKELLPCVHQAIKRTEKYYIAAGNGLTELTRLKGLEYFHYEILESPLARKQNAKVAVVVHLYYLDLLEEILGYLENILEPFDLFVTSPFASDVNQIFSILNRYNQSVTILLCENRGRDVGPFVTLYRSGLLNDYEAVLKLHSKKSKYSDQGSFWRKQLYGPLCGDSLIVLRSLNLLRNCNAGIVGPERYFLSHDIFWGANRNALTQLLKSADVDVESDGPELGFFAGTMFWFVPKALSSIHRVPNHTVAFEVEVGKQDGTLAHTWERAFCLLARACGYYATSLSLSGKDIFDIDNKNNRVPVLSIEH